MGKWHGYQDAGWNFQITAIERACLFLSLEYCLYEIPTHEFHLHFHLMKGIYPCPVKCQIEHRAEMSETHKLWLIRQSEPFGYSVFVTQDTAFSNCVILKFQFSAIIKSYFWPKDRLRQEYQSTQWLRTTIESKSVWLSYDWPFICEYSAQDNSHFFSWL